MAVWRRRSSGAVASRAVEHAVADLLVGLRATDWVAVGAATGAMLLVAALAAILPALRAAHVDPLTAIRSE
jgi:ABC-type lipoprotein release transport system permease subunit